MAANIIDSLLISLEVDPKDFDRGLEQAEQALNAFERKAMEAGKPVAQIAQEFSNWGLLAGNVSNEVAAEILKTGTASQKAALVAGRSFDSMRKKAIALRGVFSGLVAPLVAAFAGASIWQSFSEGGEKLADLSDRIGVNVQKIDMWAKANRDAGGSEEAFQSALENWTNGMGRTADSFFNLGKHIEGMSNKQAAYYLQNMGLSNEAAAVFIKYKGAASEAAEAYKDLAMTEEQARRAKEFNVLWRRLTDQIKAFGTIIIMFVLPPLELFIKALNKVVKFASEHTRFLKTAFMALGLFLGGSFVVSAIKAVGVIGAMTKGVTGLAKAARVLWVALASNPFGAAIAAATALALVVEDVWAFFDGAPSVTGVVVDAITGAFDKAKRVVIDWFNSVLEYFTNFGTQIKDAVSSWFDGVGNFFGGIFGGGDDEHRGSTGSAIAPAAQGVASAMATAPNTNNTNNNSSVQVNAYISTKDDPNQVANVVSNKTKQAIETTNNLIANNYTGVVQKG